MMVKYIKQLLNVSSFRMGISLKPCYGKCDRCVWKYNSGCSEWRR